MEYSISKDDSYYPVLGDLEHFETTQLQGTEWWFEASANREDMKDLQKISDEEEVLEKGKDGDGSNNDEDDDGNNDDNDEDTDGNDDDNDDDNIIPLDLNELQTVDSEGKNKAKEKVVSSKSNFARPQHYFQNVTTRTQATAELSYAFMEFSTSQLALTSSIQQFAHDFVCFHENSKQVKFVSSDFFETMNVTAAYIQINFLDYVARTYPRQGLAQFRPSHMIAFLKMVKQKNILVKNMNSFLKAYKKRKQPYPKIIDKKYKDTTSKQIRTAVNQVSDEIVNSILSSNWKETDYEVIKNLHTDDVKRYKFYCSKFTERTFSLLRHMTYAVEKEANKAKTKPPEKFEEVSLANKQLFDRLDRFLLPAAGVSTRRRGIRIDSVDYSVQLATNSTPKRKAAKKPSSSSSLSQPTKTNPPTNTTSSSLPRQQVSTSNANPATTTTSSSQPKKTNPPTTTTSSSLSQQRLPTKEKISTSFLPNDNEQSGKVQMVIDSGLAECGSSQGTEPEDTTTAEKVKKFVTETDKELMNNFYIDASERERELALQNRLDLRKEVERQGLLTEDLDEEEQEKESNVYEFPQDKQGAEDCEFYNNIFASRLTKDMYFVSRNEKDIIMSNTPTIDIHRGNISYSTRQTT